ncbi:MAG: hypothetical protein H0T92_17005 [Pyrinomonadaceae bacterium]|nr:hypothetical protein [Pyrinomonadaceae bacterium]
MTRAATASAATTAVTAKLSPRVPIRCPTTLWKALDQSQRTQIAQRLAELMRRARTHDESLREGGRDELG